MLEKLRLDAADGGVRQASKSLTPEERQVLMDWGGRISELLYAALEKQQGFPDQLSLAIANGGSKVADLSDQLTTLTTVIKELRDKGGILPALRDIAATRRSLPLSTFLAFLDLPHQRTAAQAPVLTSTERTSSTPWGRFTGRE